MKFKKNIGKKDQLIRYIAGVVLIIVGFLLQGIISLVLFILATIIILTGIIGWCGLYTILGVNTCKRK